MKRRKLSPRSRTRSKSHFVYTLLALGMSCHSCADIPAGSELTARIGLDAHVKAWDWAVLDHGSLPEARLRACACDAFQGHRRVFSACRHFLQKDSPRARSSTDKPRPLPNALRKKIESTITRLSQKSILPALRALCPIQALPGITRSLAVASPSITRFVTVRDNT